MIDSYEFVLSFNEINVTLLLLFSKLIKSFFVDIIGYLLWLMIAI